MNYKKSRYNIIIPYKDNEYIIFNTYSGAFGKFDLETMEKYKNGTLTENENDILKAKKIIIPSYINELDFINKDRADGIYFGYKSYRIWTTSECNARCYYCFEKGIHSESMTSKTADALVVFINNLVTENDFVSIEWFGGEPLLNPFIIDYITPKLSIFFEQKNINWKASMISNGSLITDDIVTKCVTKWNIGKMQITLDGFDNDYNQTKNYYCPEKHNFNHVISNIKKLADAGIKVSIRMNYDTKNYDSLKRLIDYLHIEFCNTHNISYYIYPIWDGLGERQNKFISKTKADNQLIKLIDSLVNYGMATARNILRLSYKHHQCSSCGIHNYSFLPNGKVLKCSEAFNSVLGDVFEGIFDENTAGKWTDPGIDEDCKQCVYLPLCQGGCRASKVTTMPRCIAFKEIIPDLLRWYMKNLEKKQI